MPQLYVPQDCSAVLPVGAVNQTNVFWRITAIETDIDFSQLVDEKKPPSKQPPARIHSARLGLPLAIWAPAWAGFQNVKAAQTTNGETVSVGIDRLFLPSGKPASASRPSPAPLAVVDLTALELGTIRHPSGGRVQAVAKTVDQLLESGEGLAYLLNARGNRTGSVTLTLREYTAQLSNLSWLTTAPVRIQVDGAIESVELDSDQRGDLMGPRAFTRVRAGKRAVRLTLAREPSLSSDGIIQATPPQTQIVPIASGFGFSMKDFLGLRPLDSANPDAPMTEPVRELPRIEIVLATPIVQRWTLLGYERGPLIGSVLLEPGTEASIEVFSWERLRLEREELAGTSLEENTELTALARSTARVAVDTATELGTRFDFGGGAAIPVEAVSGAKLQLSGNVETQTAVNTNVENGLERVAESTRRSAERFQATHQVKIVQTTERGRETRSTRKLRNPNVGRTLEFLHFAINERHRVTTQIEGQTRVVVCIENPSLGAFDIDLIFAHEHVLKRSLLSEDYFAGFAAARLLAAQQAFDDVLVAKERRAAIQRVIDRLKSKKEQTEGEAGQGAAEPGIPVTGIYQTARQIQKLLKEFIEIDLGAEAQVLADNLNPGLPKDKKPSRRRVKKADARFSRWGFWAKFTTTYPGLDDKAADFVALKFDGADHASEEDVVAALQTLTDGLDDDWVAAVKMIAVATIVGTAASIIGGPLSGILQPIIIGLLLVSDDMGLPRAITRARQELVGERAAQHGVALAEKLGAESEAPANGQAPAAAAPATAPTPQILTDRELAEARADFRKLQKHLQAHATYYRNAIWRAEDPTDRFIRLEAMGLAPYVENVLVGFVGNRAMYSLRLEALPKQARDVVAKAIGGQALDANYHKQFTPIADEIVLPTPAVHCEGFLGSCELLEPYIVERRKIDLEVRRARALREAELARQEGFQSQRFEARLLKDPPVLDDPRPNTPGYPGTWSDVDDTGGVGS